MAAIAASMIYLNEWLPNPSGPDAKGEFIELYNSGSQAESLAGWALNIGPKKNIPLSGSSIGPGKYFIVTKNSAPKLSLKNSDGKVSLYGPGGVLEDEGHFVGQAPEGKSFSRVDYRTGPTEHFLFTPPTPGRENQKVNDAIAVRAYPENVPLNSVSAGGSFLGEFFLVSATITALFFYAITKDENISKLFFEGD